MESKSSAWEVTQIVKCISKLKSHFEANPRDIDLLKRDKLINNREIHELMHTRVMFLTI